jgi:hypothetical protein
MQGKLKEVWGQSTSRPKLLGKSIPVEPKNYSSLGVVEQFLRNALMDELSTLRCCFLQQKTLNVANRNLVPVQP